MVILPPITFAVQPTNSTFTIQSKLISADLIFLSLSLCRKAKRSGSNIFALFSQKQIQEFKEAFGIMDTDKDGIISSSDLKTAFTNVGKSIGDGDATSMLSEAPGPVNFTQLVTLFAEKMAGGE